ncbi:MAG: metalloregulator ArsR/SmtB family transcription factor [Chloroflexi bacterium]|nr:metalloregulator ArsR/SmtB family transcription factor [Chloroflexota bacterium]
MAVSQPLVIKCSPQQCRHIAKQAAVSHPLLTDETQLKARGRIFQALGNETRLRILATLSVQELCACDVVAALGGAATTVAFHLRMLEDAGLISARQTGKFTLYRLNRELLDRHCVLK